MNGWVAAAPGNAYDLEIASADKDAILGTR